jgi:hypothetical protein
MPLFNNRAGNGGTGKGILTTLGHRREALSLVRAAGEVSGNVKAVAPHLPEKDREIIRAAAGAPQPKAFAAASAAGVSPRKQMRVFNRGQKRGQSLKGIKKFNANLQQIAKANPPFDPFA